MSILIWIIVGGIAGEIANILVGHRSGCISNIFIGMIGSLVGGSLVVLLDTGNLDYTTAFTRFSLTNIVVSTIGAIVFLLFLKLLRGR